MNKYNEKRKKYLEDQKQKLPNIHQADITPQKVIIQRKFNKKEYKERLDAVQSHYFETNCPPGLSQEQIIFLKKFLPSAALAKCDPPRIAFVSNNDRKKVKDGKSESFDYRRGIVKSK